MRRLWSVPESPQADTVGRRGTLRQAGSIGGSRQQSEIVSGARGVVFTETRADLLSPTSIALDLIRGRP